MRKVKLAARAFHHAGLWLPTPPKANSILLHAGISARFSTGSVIKATDSVARSKRPNGYWADEANRRALFDDMLAKIELRATSETGIHSYEAWYRVRISEIRALGGYGLLNDYYGGSLVKALKNLYPEHDWQEWRFTKVPVKHWANLPAQRRFFDWLATQLSITRLEQWYSVAPVTVKKHGGGYLLDELYNNNLGRAMESIYPEHPWLAWKFGKVPTGFWSKRENQLKYMDWVRKDLGMASLDAFYQLKNKELAKRGGRSLLKLFNDSVSTIVRTLYPSHPWKLWKFHKSPVQFWDSKDHQREFMDSLKEELGIAQPSDWYSYATAFLCQKPTHCATELLALDMHPNYCGNYSITTAQIYKKGGSGLLSHRYGDSMHRLLAGVYPGHEWLEWKFTRVPVGFWDHEPNRLKFLSHFASSNNIASFEDWYNVTAEQLSLGGGAGLLSRYRNSMSAMLSNLFPAHNWQAWRFEKSPSSQPGDETTSITSNDFVNIHSGSVK